MSADDFDSTQPPDQLVEQLVRGYDALNAEIKSLDENRRQLENKLSWAKQQYLEALKRYSSESASKDFHVFLTELEEAGLCQQEREVEWLELLAKSSDSDRRTRAYNIQRAEDAREKIRYRHRANDGMMERDFTTPGTPGRLGCPFAVTAKSSSAGAKRATGTPRSSATPRSSTSRSSQIGRRSKRPSFHDPIKAETSANDHVSGPASVEGSVPLCPIRFLDQHSPEELANYFEKHKHELPRSHEMCVGRFQGDKKTLRQLDAKYGNMESMFADLGVMHKPMLPDAEDIAIEDEEVEGVQNSTSKVQNWAKAISVGIESEREAVVEPNDTEEDRDSRFDRPLKDVRVGESPSRPWGIPIPVNYTANGDAAPAKSDHTASPLELSTQQQTNDRQAKTCPFGFGMTETKPGKEAYKAQDVEAGDDAPPPPPPPAAQDINKGTPVPQALQGTTPRVVFQGPVFIGYPMDQVNNILESLGLGPKS